MKKKLIKIRELFIRVKVYFKRASSYISMVNTSMILFLFLSNLENYNIDIDIKEWIIPIGFAGVLLMILFGYLEDKLGFYSQEQKTIHSRSPVLSKLDKRLEQIEKKIDKLQK